MQRISTRTLTGCLPIVALAWMGCSPEAIPADLEPGRATSAIQGGEEDTNDPAVVGVVSSQSGGGVGMCSGSLIAPNLVLTARHCVAPTSSEYVNCAATSFGEPYPPSSFAVTTAWDGLERLFYGKPPPLYYVSEVILPPEEGGFCGRDVALLRLGGEGVPPTEALPIYPRVDIDVSPHEAYRAVGFGNTSANGGGAGRRRMRGDLIVACAGNCFGHDLINGKEWLGDTGICSGDSGGPALDPQGRVIGVVSRGGQLGDLCTSPIYGSVFGWGDWLREHAAAAAVAGGYEPAAWVTGGSSMPETDAGALPKEAGPPEAGDAAASVPYPEGGTTAAVCHDAPDCRSGICIGGGEGEGYCAAPCGLGDRTCPGGFSCDLGLGACVLPGEPNSPCSSNAQCASSVCLLQGATGVCAPWCASQADCQRGKTCDVERKACVDAVDSIDAAGGCRFTRAPVASGVGWGWLALGVLLLGRRRRAA